MTDHPVTQLAALRVRHRGDKQGPCFSMTHSEEAVQLKGARMGFHDRP
jgi:hypothetical protein